MDRAWVPEAKEVQDKTICWLVDGHNILGRKRRYCVGLFTQEKYNNWSALCKLARPAENRHPWKKAEVNYLKVFCFNRTTQKSTLANLQWML